MHNEEKWSQETFWIEKERYEIRSVHNTHTANHATFNESLRKTATKPIGTFKKSLFTLIAKMNALITNCYKYDEDSDRNCTIKFMFRLAINYTQIRTPLIHAFSLQSSCNQYCPVIICILYIRQKIAGSPHF